MLKVDVKKQFNETKIELQNIFDMVKQAIEIYIENLMPPGNPLILPESEHRKYQVNQADVCIMLLRLIKLKEERLML